MDVIKYDKSKRVIWDEFIKNSKNGHFMFYRDYMEYHSNRFEDYSLLIYDNNKLISLLPANIKDNVLHSHSGLSFGGFITNIKMTANKMFEIFQTLNKYSKENNFKEIIYKSIPNIYYKVPSDEDKYALFQIDANLYRRDIASTIDLSNKLPFSKGHKAILKKAKTLNFEVQESTDFISFMKLEKDLLNNKYDTNPVHSGEEIKMLAKKFPNNIKLFLVKKDNNIISGTILFINNQTIHCQYIANSEIGKEKGAFSLIVDYLINDKYKSCKYFDFGISTENEGKYLNRDLIRNKEGYGARATICDFYKIRI